MRSLYSLIKGYCSPGHPRESSDSMSEPVNAGPETLRVPFRVSFRDPLVK